MASPAAIHVPVEVYLRTAYRPDREYVDGEVLERNLGERDHAGIQMALGRWCEQYRRAAGLVGFAELRVQVTATRYRVPDLCVLRKDAPREQVVRQAPLICIEVLSPEDTVQRTLARVEDYRAMGVEGIWILDPAGRKGYDCRRDGLRETLQFATADGAVRLDLAALFADLDQAATLLTAARGGATDPAIGLPNVHGCMWDPARGGCRP